MPIVIRQRGNATTDLSRPLPSAVQILSALQHGTVFIQPYTTNAARDDEALLRIRVTWPEIFQALFHLPASTLMAAAPDDPEAFLRALRALRASLDPDADNLASR